MIDFDDDGDEDLFVLNAGSANQLLRNDGFYTYTDVTPANLANADAIGSGLVRRGWRRRPGCVPLRSGRDESAFRGDPPRIRPRSTT